MTGSEIAIIETPAAQVAVRDTVDGWLTMFEPVARLAVEIAPTEFVPAALRGKPAAITAAILYGRELGLGPIQALQSIDVIDGRPAVSAEMARALALSAGHELYVEETTTTRCVVRGRRAGGGEWVTVTWTMDDAKRAGLDGRPNYRKHPRRMLQARATAELCHLLFSDAIGGMPFLVEEAQDDTDLSGDVGAEKPARTARRGRRATPATDPGDAPPLPGDEPAADPPAEPVAEEPQPDPATATANRGQIQKVLIAFKALGIDDRDERLTTSSKIIRRDLTSANDLTATEASTLIDTLERVGAAPDPPATLMAILAATDEAQPQLPVTA
jgi:hypothetical protein